MKNNTNDVKELTAISNDRPYLWHAPVNPIIPTAMASTAITISYHHVRKKHTNDIKTSYEHSNDKNTLKK